MLKLKLNPVHMSDIDKREQQVIDFIKYFFNFDLRSDIDKLICFKLGMMLDTNKVYILIPVWMTLILTHGYLVARKLEFVWLFFGMK